MLSKPQIHHKSNPRPNFAIIPNSFDIKKHAQPHSTLRIAWKHQKQIQKLQKNIKIQFFQSGRGSKFNIVRNSN